MSEPAPPPTPAKPFEGIRRNVVALGVTSLLTDVSSESILPILPLFVVGTLHASVSSLGMIEGIAECTASVLRIWSGRLSDRIGHRKPFVMFGYGLSGVAKAAFAFASSWPAVLALRFTDRVGKGLRSPARDALIAESVEPRFLGRAFGFHRALDTLGAAIGPLVAFLILARWPGDFRRVFLWSAVPAILSVLVLWVFVRAPQQRPAKMRSLGGEFRALGTPFHRFLIVDALFQLGNSSNAFILLRTQQAGFDAGHVALVYLAYNVAYALLSYPLGDLSDRIGRRPLLLSAYALYAVVYGLLALAPTKLTVVVGFLLLGLHSALLEGQQRSLIADFVPDDRRATAYGFYYTVVGAALLPASILAGVLWDRFGATTTFAVDAALALAAAALFLVLLPASRERGERHAH